MHPNDEKRLLTRRQYLSSSASGLGTLALASILRQEAGLEQTAPDRYTSVLSKKARKGRIFVDYLRNGRGSTAVAPWSSRGKPKATVAVPVTFEMVRDGVGPADFTIGSKALEDALKRPDPWADFFTTKQSLTREVRGAFE